MNASARSTVTMSAPPSYRWAVPVTISPTRLLNSSKMLLRSSSRNFWIMTCLKVWAAMRPKASGASQRLAVAEEVICAVDGVERAGELLGVEGVVELAGRGHHRLLEVADRAGCVDVAVAGDRVEDAHHLGGCSRATAPRDTQQYSDKPFWVNHAASGESRSPSTDFAGVKQPENDAQRSCFQRPGWRRRSIPGRRARPRERLEGPGFPGIVPTLARNFFSPSIDRTTGVAACFSVVITSPGDIDIRSDSVIVVSASTPVTSRGARVSVTWRSERPAAFALLFC
jgi:hypothetical protein